MNLDKAALLNFYTEYKDSNGHKHYAINQYRKSDGWIWSMKDFKFQTSNNLTKSN